MMPHAQTHSHAHIKTKLLGIGVEKQQGPFLGNTHTQSDYSMELLSGPSNLWFSWPNPSTLHTYTNIKTNNHSISLWLCGESNQTKEKKQEETLMWRLWMLTPSNLLTSSLFLCSFLAAHGTVTHTHTHNHTHKHTPVWLPLRVTLRGVCPN